MPLVQGDADSFKKDFLFSILKGLGDVLTTDTTIEQQSKNEFVKSAELWDSEIFEVARAEREC